MPASPRTLAHNSGRVDNRYRFTNTRREKTPGGKEQITGVFSHMSGTMTRCLARDSSLPGNRVGGEYSS
jgi:hypothetical protein